MTKANIQPAQPISEQFVAEIRQIIRQARQFYREYPIVNAPRSQSRYRPLSETLNTETLRLTT